MEILYLLMTVLKFIGLLLLILVLVFLFLIIIVLTVPIKYSLDVEKTDTLYVLSNIKWLYSMVAMDIIYRSDQEVIKVFKLFGKPIKPRKPRKPRKSKKITKERPLSHTSKKTKKVETSKKQPTVQKPVKQKQVKPKKLPKEKKGGFKDAIRQIQSFDYKKDLIIDTINFIIQIFKSMAPSFLHIDIEIGKEDPADTGQLMAMLSSLYPFYYQFANIVGNYEKECLYGKIKTSGDLTLGRFVYDFVKYIRTSSVKELIRIIRKNWKEKRHGRKTAK